MVELETLHKVAESPAHAIQQWFNAGGMLQFYDYPLKLYINVGLLLLVKSKSFTH